MDNNSILLASTQVDEGFDLGGGLDDAFGCSFLLFFLGLGVLSFGTLIYKVVT